MSSTGPCPARRSAAARRRLADESGSAGISTFVVVMTVIALLGLGVGGMRTFIGASDLKAASRAAARAAALEHDLGSAQSVADVVVRSELTDAGQACENPAVNTDPGPGGFEPGGSVVVQLSCDVSYRGLFTPWSQGRKRITVTSTEPIDCLRGGGSRVVDDNCYLGG